MDTVRTAQELARPSYAAGTVAYVADRARLMAASQFGAYQDVMIGNVRTVTATGTALKSDGLIILSGTGTYTYNLPTAASMSGSRLAFVKTGASGVVTLDGAGAETINGAATLTVTAQWRIVELYSDGTQWIMLSNHTPVAG